MWNVAVPQRQMACGNINMMRESPQTPCHFGLIRLKHCWGDGH